MFKQKLSLIYLPFILIGLSFIGLYTLLNWLIFIKLELFEVRSIITSFGLPFLLIGTVAFIWLNPRIKLLDLKRKNREFTNFYLLTAVIAIVLPTVISQEYLTTASGKLTELSSISSIHKQEKTKYYTVKDYFVSSQDIGEHSSLEVSGRHNENLEFSVFLTLPLYDSFADSFQPTSSAWLGVKYSKTISNKLSDNEVADIIQKFIKKIEKDLNARNIEQFTYLDRIGYSDDLEGYKEALKTSSKFNSTNDIILVPFTTAFEARNGKSFEWIFFSYGIGALLWLIMLLFPSFEEKRLQAFLNQQPLEEESDWKDLMSFFILKKGYYVTPLLMYLNIGIFLILFLSGSGFISFKTNDLLQWGANSASHIEAGEYWRLLSNIFLHGGLPHLVLNLFALALVGFLLEPFLGSFKFAFAYIATGVLASLASFYWAGNTSVGASGAILGLYGVSLSLLSLKVFPEEMEPFFNYLVGIASGSLVMGFIYPGIDNAAHIGGFLSGCLLGLAAAAFGTKLDDGTCNA